MIFNNYFKNVGLCCLLVATANFNLLTDNLITSYLRALHTIHHQRILSYSPNKFKSPLDDKAQQ